MVALDDDCKVANNVVRAATPFAENISLGHCTKEIGAGERNRTVVSALARPHSAVEPHSQKLASPAGLSPAT